MTPERVKEIAEAAWIHPHRVEIDVAIERAIRQAVNEFAAECVKIADDQIRLAQQINDPTGYLVSKEIKNAIDALKLPEEK